jgi:molybdopterin converting factor small subunit
MIKVLFFGPARDATRISEYEYSITTDTKTLEKSQFNVTKLISHLIEKFPNLQHLMPSCVIARNGEYVPMDTIIQDDDEIALIPPLSGG